MQDGILVIDKPEGISSAAALAIVKRVTRVGKIGHAGTLDPMATGVLVCMIGKATRLSAMLMEGRKRYEARITLGIETDTQDRTGRIVRRQIVPPLDTDRIAGALDRFVGEIDQIPPVFSALKHQGTALYRLARNGKPLQKPARRVRIETIRLLRWAPPDIDIDVVCSSGTYIRSLASDIGNELGCGGVLSALRRTEACGCSLADALALERIRHLGGRCLERLISPLQVLSAIPRVIADNALTKKLCYGKIILASDMGESETAGRVAVVDSQERLLAILEYESGQKRFRYICNWTETDTLST
ncbi:tRNA pseudouridine(55) synthase TruB [Desulfatirhabdium butyrativorans]|uniref:tRNA pseudouridine(55) synthase TruB n=1 Tax=Desulfatirhabdium butyrativorans TaxID=340467 RepID=UPI00040253D5|nr:tRNA pseudouridine(55) synthase TruB [Desulfatirhabdium butyrativorans]